MISGQTESFEVEEVDIEEHAKRGGPAPSARRYVIRVDKLRLTFNVSHAKGREILTEAGKEPPEQYKLRQRLHGGAVKDIRLDEDVDFRAPGVERFVTLKLDQTEG